MTARTEIRAGGFLRRCVRPVRGLDARAGMW